MDINLIEEMLSKPYWIIDILPKQVPAGAGGQYFAVEEFYLREPRVSALREKQLGFVLKLNCYCDITVGDKVNPEPDKLAMLIGKTPLDILVGGALLTMDPGDTYMTLYGADEDLIAMAKTLSSGEGLYLWKPEQ